MKSPAEAEMLGKLQGGRFVVSVTAAGMFMRCMRMRFVRVIPSAMPQSLLHRILEAPWAQHAGEVRTAGREFHQAAKSQDFKAAKKRFARMLPNCNTAATDSSAVG